MRRNEHLRRPLELELHRTLTLTTLRLTCLVPGRPALRRPQPQPSGPYLSDMRDVTRLLVIHDTNSGVEALAAVHREALSVAALGRTVWEEQHGKEHGRGQQGDQEEREVRQ